MDNSFRQEFEKQLSISGTLYQRIKKIMEIKNISIEDFYDSTKLNRTVLYDIKKNKKPQLRTVVTICIGLELGTVQSLELIRLAGYSLSNTFYLDYVYFDLINHYNDYGIEECNKRLKELGIEKKYYLGSIQRK